VKPYPLYVWSQLLGRVFNILRENNPDLAGDRRRTVMRPPQVLREGTKKTVFVNFMDLCKTYDPIHLTVTTCVSVLDFKKINSGAKSKCSLFQNA
jgi:translation initiation factor 2 beta subunit (eIF-2beta)/eIF-5